MSPRKPASINSLIKPSVSDTAAQLLQCVVHASVVCTLQTSGLAHRTEATDALTSLGCPRRCASVARDSTAVRLAIWNLCQRIHMPWRGGGLSRAGVQSGDGLWCACSVDNVPWDVSVNVELTCDVTLQITGFKHSYDSTSLSTVKSHLND